MMDLPTYEAAELFTPKGNKGIIACGSYGTVRICKYSESKLFAVKCLFLTGSEEVIQEKKERALNESRVLNKVAHLHIIKFYGITTWSNHVGIITEHASGGNLDELLCNKLIEIPWKLSLRIALQLSDALVFLHNYKPSKALIHGDVKSVNVFLTNQLDVKLGDFGSANMHKSAGATETTTNLPQTNQHTPFFTAPEFLKNFSIPRTPEMDVYSFGMVLYEILTKMRIFDDVRGSPGLIIQCIKDVEQRPNEKHLSSISSDLFEDDLEIFTLLQSQMKHCWSQDPLQRPKIRTVYRILLTQFNKANRNAVTEIASNLAKTLKIRDMDFDTVSATTLNHTTPAVVDIWPITLETVPDFEKQVRSTLHSIKKSLIKKEIDNALKQTNQIITISISNEKGDWGELVLGVTSIVADLSDHLDTYRTVTIIRWAKELCRNIEHTRDKLDKLKMCASAVNSLVISLNKIGKTQMIQSYCVYLLLELYREIQLVETDNQGLKANTKAWCLYFIGHCYYLIGFWNKVDEICDNAIECMTEAFGAGAGNYHVFAACHLVSAHANYLMKKHVKPTKQYKQAVKPFQMATDINETDREKMVKISTTWLNISRPIKNSIVFGGFWMLFYFIILYHLDLFNLLLS